MCPRRPAAMARHPERDPAAAAQRPRRARPVSDVRACRPPRLRRQLERMTPMPKPKPPLEIPDDDGQDPGEEPVPDEEFMHPEHAAGDETVDDAENDDRPPPG